MNPRRKIAWFIIAWELSGFLLGLGTGIFLTRVLN